jgi:hypothetical protein
MGYQDGKCQDGKFLEAINGVLAKDAKGITKKIIHCQSSKR